MKKRLIFYFVLAISLLSINNCLFAHDRKISLVTGEWAPYTSKTMENYGAFTEVVSAVFKEMKYQPEYIFSPWKRAENMVETGKVFAAFPFVINDERKKVFDFSDRVAFSTGRFFYSSKNFAKKIHYTMLSELKSYKIGGVLGYWYEPLFKKEQLELHFVASEKQVIQMLYNRRLDLAPLDELVGWQLIQKLYPDETQVFKTLDRPLNKSSLHLLVSRSYPRSKNLTDAFNTALKHVYNKGIYQEIMQKYGISVSYSGE